MKQFHNNGGTGCTNGGYSQPFGHLMNPLPPQPPVVGMVQMANGPKGGPQTMLLGGPGAFGAHIGPMGHTNLSQSTGQAQSVASLQMV